jgi:site-specific recombinase XerD
MTTALTTQTTSNFTFLLPQPIADLGEDAVKAFIEFFTAQIRNPNTREAYFRNATRFLTAIEEAGVALRDVQPVHVAGYIEQLSRTHSAPTVKQHLATLRMLGAFLVIRQVLVDNPAADVRGPKHVVNVGKTPSLEGADARTLFESIETDTPAGVRDRALLGVMVYSFGRISAVLNLDIRDYYQNGSRRIIRLLEKGGRHHEMPVHHTSAEYLHAYLDMLGATDGPLFRTVDQKRTGFTERRMNRREALAMVKRRCKAAGLGERFSNHTFRATGITAYLSNGGQLENAQFMAGHASPTTTKLYDRRRQQATLDEVERIRL